MAEEERGSSFVDITLQSPSLESLEVIPPSSDEAASDSDESVSLLRENYDHDSGYFDEDAYSIYDLNLVFLSAAAPALESVAIQRWPPPVSEILRPARPTLATMKLQLVDKYNHFAQLPLTAFSIPKRWNVAHQKKLSDIDFYIDMASMECARDFTFYTGFTQQKAALSSVPYCKSRAVWVFIGGTLQFMDERANTLAYIEAFCRFGPYLDKTRFFGGLVDHISPASFVESTTRAMVSRGAALLTEHAWAGERARRFPGTQFTRVSYLYTLTVSPNGYRIITLPTEHPPVLFTEHPRLFSSHREQLAAAWEAMEAAYNRYLSWVYNTAREARRLRPRVRNGEIDSPLIVELNRPGTPTLTHRVQQHHPEQPSQVLNKPALPSNAPFSNGTNVNDLLLGTAAEAALHMSIEESQGKDLYQIHGFNAAALASIRRTLRQTPIEYGEPSAEEKCARDKILPPAKRSAAPHSEEVVKKKIWIDLNADDLSAYCTPREAGDLAPEYKTLCWNRKKEVGYNFTLTIEHHLSDWDKQKLISFNDVYVPVPARSNAPTQEEFDDVHDIAITSKSLADLNRRRIERMQHYSAVKAYLAMVAHYIGQGNLAGARMNLGQTRSMWHKRSTLCLPLAPLETREQTFDDYKWPHASWLPGPILAAAGFSYFGQNDMVVCFSCGAVLNEWRPGDDPIKRHALVQFDIVAAKSNRGDLLTDYCYFAGALCGTEQITALRNNTETMIVNKEPCYICAGDFPANCRFDCGHFACACCAGPLHTCPLCRRSITTVKHYTDE